MAQIFPRWTNKIPLLLGVGTPVILSGVVFGIWYYFSPSFTDVGYQPEQPVPFSHALHVGQIGMDCRYCHNTVERASAAAIPPADTCMNCHSQLNLGERDNRIEPIKQAYDGGQPVEWVKVHMLPDYAYFDHSVHVAGGVGCETCHGRIDQMETVFQQEPLSMSWCLDCHRNPTPSLRPAAEVTTMGWAAKHAAEVQANQAEPYNPHTDSARTRAVQPPEHCSGCHR